MKSKKRNSVNFVYSGTSPISIDFSICQISELKKLQTALNNYLEYWTGKKRTSK